MSTATFTYNRTHTATFVADNMRNVLRDIISWSGLDPTKLADDWLIVGEAVRTWLQSEDLLEITLEFFMPGSDRIVARWDFPIRYDGSGTDDDMWVAKEHIKRT